MRRISEEDAQLFLRFPEKLLEMKQARYDALVHRGYIEKVVDPASEFYDWHVLTALVSGSAAWELLAKCGQRVGDAEQMGELLDADARILSVEQVKMLDASLKELLAKEDEQTLIDCAMLEARYQWPKWWLRSDAEINLELYWIKQQVQQFIQKAVEAEEALLIIA